MRDAALLELLGGQRERFGGERVLRWPSFVAPMIGAVTPGFASSQARVT